MAPQNAGIWNLWCDILIIILDNIIFNMWEWYVWVSYIYFKSFLAIQKTPKTPRENYLIKILICNITRNAIVKYKTEFGSWTLNARKLNEFKSKTYANYTKFQIEVADAVTAGYNENRCRDPARSMSAIELNQNVSFFGVLSTNSPCAAFQVKTYVIFLT